jgi:hypothetical protein
MGSEDDTVIMPRGEGGGSPPEGQPQGGPGGPKAPSGNERVLIISTVAAIFIVAAVIVIVIRACGGDEPAPQSVNTVVKTVIETTTVEPDTDTEETVPDEPPARGDIYTVNWKSEVGAQPMVRDVEDVIYSDLDGDGYDDALVLVRLEGSGAYLDYYVYTYRGESLVLLFDKTEVDHGAVELGSIPRSFVETTAVYAPTDPNCCPSELKYTTYTWSSSADGFVETSVEIVPNPAV